MELRSQLSSISEETKGKFGTTIEDCVEEIQRNRDRTWHSIAIRLSNSDVDVTDDMIGRLIEDAILEGASHVLKYHARFLMEGLGNEISRLGYNLSVDKDYNGEDYKSPELIEAFEELKNKETE
tara:strand:- start:162 stop:533 length:372 start_codon:yes stop_codon:yes gene_type:complete